VELNTKIQIHSRITHLRSYLTGKFYMLANILYFTISIEEDKEEDIGDEGDKEKNPLTKQEGIKKTAPYYVF
jgi:hypothetical protein